MHFYGKKEKHQSLSCKTAEPQSRVPGVVVRRGDGESVSLPALCRAEESYQVLTSCSANLSEDCGTFIWLNGYRERRLSVKTLSGAKMFQESNNLIGFCRLSGSEVSGRPGKGMGWWFENLSTDSMTPLPSRRRV